jgi:hypothetical protein
MAAIPDFDGAKVGLCMLEKVLGPVVVGQRGQLGCWQMRDLLCGANYWGDMAVGTNTRKGTQFAQGWVLSRGAANVRQLTNTGKMPEAQTLGSTGV